MELIGRRHPIDLAFLPIGDNFTMGIDDAVEAVKLLRPKVVVPIHYGTFPVIEVDPDEFCSEGANGVSIGNGAGVATEGSGGSLRGSEGRKMGRRAAFGGAPFRWLLLLGFLAASGFLAARCLLRHLWHPLCVRNELAVGKPPNPSASFLCDR
jgi:hypothetical protein